MKKIFIGCCLLISSAALTAQTFDQLKKLVAADRAAGNQLGTAVAISGNYAVVGASDISEGNIQNSGQCAYVFERDASGNWNQIQKLTASDKISSDNFGQSVSISGNYIIVGAPGKDNHIGAAYIFKRNASGTWTEEKKIVAPDRSAGDRFGTSVSITSVYGHGDGSYVLVGAPGDGDYGSMPKLSGAGSVYFFSNLNGVWEVLHKAGPDITDRSANAGFGSSVAMSGTAAVIGAPYEKKDATGTNPMDAAGAAYVFERGGSGAFQLVHKIVNWDRAVGDQFGYAVAINGNTVMVGAPFEDQDNRAEPTTLLSAGSVYVFEKKSDNQWWWTEKLVANDRAAGDGFGVSVSFSGKTAVIGAATSDEAFGPLSSSGSAYIFLYGDLYGWMTKQIRVVATDRASNDWFGYAVAADGDNILVGTPFQDRNETRIMAEDAGAAYFFGKKSCSSTTSAISQAACKTFTSPSKKYTWTQSGTYTDIIPNKAGCDSTITINLTITGKADTSVTVKGNSLMANATNASYQWIDCATDQPININTRTLIATVNGSYKVSIEYDGCRGVSSCHTVNPNKPIDKEPADTVITTPVSNSQLKEFVEINKLIPKDRQGYENFGYAVAISGEYAVIGANVDDKDAKGQNPINDAGSAYIFKKDKDGKWKQVQKIVASDREAGDNFGWSVAINNNHIVVGAPYHDRNLGSVIIGPSSGSAYIFELNESGIWAQKQKIIAHPIESQILFGYSVAIDGNTIAVGCPWYAKDETGKPETNINSAGAVFVFDKTGGTWIQSQIITPKIRNINNLGDDFGYSVSICGDRIIAGAPFADLDANGGNKMEESGVAYIFERSGGKWNEVQKIVSLDRAPHDKFGSSVSISGDNAIIGAWQKTETPDPNSRPFTGNAYIFSSKAPPGNVRPGGGVILTPDDGSWKQVLKINPEDRKPDDYLGWSVSISGDYAIVSARNQDTDSLDNRIPDGGAIYVYYQEKNGRWSQTGKLATFDRSQLDNFGYAVAISGCDIIGGTIVDQEDDNDGNALTSAGSAYVFSAADCRNVARCYRSKVTPDIKTPKDKTDPIKNLETNPKPKTNDKEKNNKPEKIQSPDLKGNSNETVINPVDIGNGGITQPVTINKPKPKIDSVKNSNAYNPKTIRLCIDHIKTETLPQRPPDEIYRFVPKINPDGTVEEIPGVIRDQLSMLTDKIWNAGQELTVGFYSNQTSNFVINKVKQYAVIWQNIANIRFRFVPGPAGATIRVGFDTTDGSWSHIGRNALLVESSKKTMNFGWLTDTTTEEEFRRVIMHEFGHAIGFIHEHQTPTGGIQWDKDKVYSYFGSSPNNWSQDQVDQQIFAKYATAETNSSIYDSRSIMHYYFPPELTKNGFSFSKNTSLSKMDSSFVKLVYPLPFEPGDARGMLLTGGLDCDEIPFIVDYNAAGVASNEIEFILEPGIDHHGNWITEWKKITIPLKGGGEATMEIQNKSVANRKIAVSLIDKDRPMRFWKAKLLGIHTLLDKKWHVMPALVGGCRVRLTWRKDSCL